MPVARAMGRKRVDVRVVVVAAIRLYRDGLASALLQMPDVEIVVTADTRAAATVSARLNRCDIALVDMTDPENADTARALIECQPGLKAVALAAPESDARIVACAEVGISGYVAREANLEQLVETLRAVRRGEAVCSARATAWLLRYIARNASNHRNAMLPPQLTHREGDVLSLIADGLSNKEIATSLSIEVSTVKNHVHSLIRKLGVRSRSEAAQVGWAYAKSYPATDKAAPITS
jgi:two-component system nitrate/nitrite response regulator NarL